jgi:ligand-binding sensor domain-containing protein
MTPPVRAIRRHDGALYVATWGGGVMRLNGAALERVSVKEGDATRATSLASFGGRLVVGTAGGGLFRVDGGVLVPFAFARAPHTVWALAVHEGRLWAGGLEGVVSIPPDGPARPESDEDTRAIASSTDSVLLGTYGKGVFRSSGRGASAESSSSAFVQALDVRGQSRCVGTKSGLLVGKASAGARGLPENDVTAIARDGERLWVGTYDHGVAVLDHGAWRKIAGVDGRVNGMAVDSGARVWVATARGLSVIENDRAARTYGGGGVLPSSAVHAVTSVSSGGVLVGTERGAAIISGANVTRIDEKQGMPLRAVWAVAEAPGGVLLLGTSAGLYAGTPGGTWARASIASGHLKDDWVTALLVSGHDVFVGTYNAGVTRLTIDGTSLTFAEHLGGGYVNPAGFAAKDGTLYAATMEGLLSRPMSGGAWKTLAAASTGKDVTGVIASGSDLWVASRRGLVLARP